MATINIGELVATTLRNRTKELADNISLNIPLLYFMQKKGNVRPFDGGRDIVEELMYAENANQMWFTGWQTLDVSPNDMFDAATFDIKQCHGAVSINGLEEIQNAGKERIINLIAKRIEVAKITQRNAIAAAMYSDGTNSLQPGGLKYLVADDPTASATIGGIAQNTYSFWRNKVTTNAASATTILAAMLNLYLKCTRMTDKPNVIVSDLTYYTAFQGALTPNQRFTDAETANAGFENVKFQSTPVIYDELCPSGVSTAANARMYMINTDYLAMRPHSDVFMKPKREKESINQDGYIVPVFSALNFTCSNRALQGVLKAA